MTHHWVDFKLKCHNGQELSLQDDLTKELILGKKDYPKESKDGEVGKLKAHIHKLEKENKKLKSELRTYEKVFSKQVTFLKEKTHDLTVEELIDGADKELSLREIREEKRHNFEDMQKKWRCYKCEQGVLKLIIIPSIGGGSRYFRICNDPKCGNRTEVKTYTEEVTGVK